MDLAYYSPINFQNSFTYLNLKLIYKIYDVQFPLKSCNAGLSSTETVQYRKIIEYAIKERKEHLKHHSLNPLNGQSKFQFFKYFQPTVSVADQCHITQTFTPLIFTHCELCQ